jgi:hypothetical protein
MSALITRRRPVAGDVEPLQDESHRRFTAAFCHWALVGGIV